MKRAPHIGILMVALTVAAAPAFAQSVFNLNLMGERVAGGDVRAVSLGGSHQIVPDSLSILQSNPAMLSRVHAVTFSASQFFGGGTSRSDELTDRRSEYKLTSIGVAFPLLGGVSVGLAYHGGYDPTVMFRTPHNDSNGEGYYEKFERRGGLARYPIVLAAALGSRFRLGLEYAYESGSIEDRWTIDYNVGSYDAYSSRKRTLRGHVFGAGALVDVFENVTLGVSWRSSVDYKTRVNETYTNSTLDSIYHETTSVPDRWAAALRVSMNRKWNLYAAGYFSDFTNFEGFAFPADRLSEELGASFGVEKLQALSRYPLRFSISYDQLPYTLPADQSLSRWSLGIGTGVDLNGRKSKLDVAMVIGRVGSVDTNGYQDSFFRLYVGFSGAEPWKRERQTDY